MVEEIWEPSRLDIDDIMEITSEEELHDLYMEYDRTAIEIECNLSARRFAGIDDPSWYYRASTALACRHISKRWVERRMLTLGYKVPYQPTDPRAKQLRILQENINKLKTKIFELETQLERSKSCTS